jgi:hypothetical protein
VAGISLAWVGRALAAREAGFLRRFSDIELIPNDLGDVVVENRSMPNAIARTYIDGEPFRTKEQITPMFFEKLQSILAAIHTARVAYVDLHKRENIIVDRDGRPHLIDFQVSVGLSQSWPGNGRVARYCVAKLQEIDIYHLKKHIARCLPETLAQEQRWQFEQPPRLIRMHRKIGVPLRTIRRKLLVWLRVRDEGGSASSEFEPENAYQNVIRDVGKTTIENSNHPIGTSNIEA